MIDGHLSFEGQPSAINGKRRLVSSSLRGGLSKLPQANLALLSVPGRYVRSEAMAALRQGLHVMIFSSNVPIADERVLKEEGRRRGLLVMGPDCGTSLIGGRGLGFANVVRSGNIGAVGAAGTGLQELAVLVHRAGAGISHVLGTGSHDLTEEIGGITTLAALDLLETDDQTKVIVLLGKPPSAATAERVFQRMRRLEKPTVTCLLGMSLEQIERKGSRPAATIEDAALQAVALAQSRSATEVRGAMAAGGKDNEVVAEEHASRLRPTQRFIRGLYQGGSLANESAVILIPELGTVNGNITLPGVRQLDDARESCGHTIVDLGEEAFTLGRPHPMLDPHVRLQRLLTEARDPSVGAILLDVVLGYGSHPDPAGILAEGIREAHNICADQGRYCPMVASVCGTELDPQGLDRQVRSLEKVGVLVRSSNAQAAQLAGRIVVLASRRRGSDRAEETRGYR
jgi:FdrA protein